MEHPASRPIAPSRWSPPPATSTEADWLGWGLPKRGVEGGGPHWAPSEQDLAGWRAAGSDGPLFPMISGYSSSPVRDDNGDSLDSRVGESSMEDDDGGSSDTRFGKSSAMEGGWNSRPDEIRVWDAAGSSDRPAPATAGMGCVPLDKLDCVACHLPLKPPIYQCEVGHVVCSPCCDKLKATGKCCICLVGNGGYRRCHAMECLVESVLVQCPNAAHGCTARLTYYDQRNHSQRCAHAPCDCPEEACGFIGGKAALWHHFSAVHSWPCSKGRAGKQFDICLPDGLELHSASMNVITLRDGFNFLLADSNDHGATSIATASSKYLFLLNVSREPLGRAISVLCIHPHAAGAAGNDQGPSSKGVKCELSYTRRESSRPQGCDQVIEHYQKSRFRVACSDLSNGLSSLDGCFQFVIPDSIAADNDRDAVVVTACIIIE
ncbi:hypothetical protein PR202_gb24857 [Eleusine coracana subsp. coracana]|uniref:SIAH-type domain-containing protein n=1 Tax=Eleusine coracana subsp. coracana TaxID=191504 RepID=A0AAV5FM74_ELECO|nr:hypothetical protein QOZ80_5BG0452760 [Eleusine coracana subsp. coracana]GJN36032.1 hypothetical protein PR202_gb24857 [Eleusine coracana subsp. coracana]